MSIAGVGDFNGDGKSDILWRNSSTGQDAMFLMNGLTLTSLTFLNTVQDSSQSACNPNGPMQTAHALVTST